MQAVGQQSQRAPDGAPLHYERHRPEQTTLYRLVQQHAASFIAHTEASTGSELPRFIRDEFDTFLGCSMSREQASNAARTPRRGSNRSGPRCPKTGWMSGRGIRGQPNRQWQSRRCLGWMATPPTDVMLIFFSLRPCAQ